MVSQRSGSKGKIFTTNDTHGKSCLTSEVRNERVGPENANAFGLDLILNKNFITQTRFIQITSRWIF